MPTTRRGRFLLYKKRQRRRLKKAYGRAKRFTGDPWTENRKTNHAFDLTPFTKQMPRVYPRHFPEKWMTAEEWWSLGWTPPKRGRWGVVGPWLGNSLDRPLAWQANGAPVGYYDRRVKSIPRLRHLGHLPYQQPLDLLTFHGTYPYAVYPSGAPSWRALHGHPVTV